MASKSPRRQELLKRIIPSFEVIVSSVDEVYPSSLSNFRIPVYLAKKKAEVIAQKYPDSLVIAADTIVCVDNQILGKPKDRQEAEMMIRLLSGKTHQVITGVYLQKGKQRCHFSCKTAVTFSSLDEEEIRQYVLKESIYDKAGAYAIQEDAAIFIQSIHGDYYNVVGLPLHKLYQKLKQFNCCA